MKSLRPTDTNKQNANFHKNRYFPMIVFLIVGFYFFYSIMQLSLFNLFSPYILAKLKINSVELGVLSSTYLYTLAITLLPAGYLLDRYATRKICLITLSLSVASALLLAICHELLSIFLYRVMTGIGNGVAFLAGLRVAYYWFPKRNTLASGLIIAFGMSGGIFAAIPFSYLMHYTNWNFSLFVNAAIGIINLAFLWFFLRNHSNEYQETKENPLTFINLKKIISNSQNWLCGSYTGLLNLSINVLAVLWGNIYLTQRYHYSSTTASSIVGMIFLGIIVGSPMWGWFSDKLKKRKLPMLIGGISSFVIISLILLINQPSLFTLYSLFFALGLATCSQVISYPIIAQCNEQSLLSTALGFSALIINGIGAIVQPLFGWLLLVTWDGTIKNNMPLYSTSDFQLALMSLVIAFTLAIIITFFIKETFSYNDSIN